jgi:hypothetical protein
MRVQEDPEIPPTSDDADGPFGELAVTAPILAGKLARMSPEKLAMILPPEKTVGPL